MKTGLFLLIVVIAIVLLSNCGTPISVPTSPPVPPPTSSPPTPNPTTPLIPTPTPTPAPTPVQPDQTPSSMPQAKPTIVISELEMEIHNLVNAERQRSGFTPLEYDAKLSEIARNHSTDMATNHYFSHVNPNGQDPTARAKAAGYECYKDFGSYYVDGIAENIFQGWLYSCITYYGDTTTYDWNTQEELASSIVSGWMNSPGHRQNIFNPHCDKEGIGVSISGDGKVYITQDLW